MIEKRIIRNLPVRGRDGKRVRIDVDLTIDLDFVAYALAAKAYLNKNGRATLLGGMIEVRQRGTKADPVEDHQAA